MLHEVHALWLIRKHGSGGSWDEFNNPGLHDVSLAYEIQHAFITGVPGAYVRQLARKDPVSLARNSEPKSELVNAYLRGTAKSVDIWIYRAARESWAVKETPSVPALGN